MANSAEERRRGQEKKNDGVVAVSRGDCGQQRAETRKGSSTGQEELEVIGLRRTRGGEDSQKGKKEVRYG